MLHTANPRLCPQSLNRRPNTESPTTCKRLALPRARDLIGKSSFKALGISGVRICWHLGLDLDVGLSRLGFEV